MFFMCMFSFPSGNNIIASVQFMLLGISVIPIMGVAYSFSIEITYPLPEVLVNGMMTSSALIWGTAQGFID